MNKADYPIVVHALPKEDGGGFMATVPDLVGCMSDGETYEEAIYNVLLAMDEWTDEMVRLKRPVPAPYSLADLVTEEKKKLHELVKAQAELIERHERALDRQNASLNELRDQIKVLSAGVEIKGSVVTIGAAMDDCAVVTWRRDTCLIEGAGIVSTVGRKYHIQH